MKLVFALLNHDQLQGLNDALKAGDNIYHEEGGDRNFFVKMVACEGVQTEQSLPVLLYRVELEVNNHKFTPLQKLVQILQIAGVCSTEK